MSRGLLVWLLIMLVETIHGVLRSVLLVPRFGEEAAAGIGWPVGALLVLALSYAFIHWTRLSGGPALVRLGAIWAALTLLFEIAIGLLRGFDTGRIAAEINPAAGGTMLYSIALMFFAPLIADWLRRLGKPPRA